MNGCNRKQPDRFGSEAENPPLPKAVIKSDRVNGGFLEFVIDR
jgi:hypothetical protein